MIKIYKYFIHIGQQTLSVPGFLKALSVREQRGFMILYCLVDAKSHSMVSVEVLVLGTGHDASASLGSFFVGSIELPVMQEIYHTFIKVK
jgi:hypothetical protein